MVLRPKHFVAIGLLVGTDLLQRDVARQVGIHRRTLGRWLKDETFRAELARQRELLPARLESLRKRAMHGLLVNVTGRLEAGDEKLPLKEITQLLKELVAEPFQHPIPDTDGQDRLPELTPEEAERLWETLEEGETAAKGPDNPKTP